MIAKRTAIGVAVGSIIFAMGLLSLIDSIGLQTYNENETLGIGESTSFTIDAPTLSQQKLKITGDTFDVKIEHTIDGVIMPLTTHKKEFSIEWVHKNDGQSSVEIQNTGQSDIELNPTFQYLIQPIEFTFHIMVITSGIIILGFSAGFSTRKPKGF